MNPVAQYSKEKYSRDTILDVPWNTVISFPLSRKTMYGLVSTCFSLGILSSCPVCEKWWHLQPLQGNCPGWFPQWGVQVVTIWQDICSATGRALDAATCPQRRHCTLPFEGRRILCISTRWTVRVTRGERVGFPLWLWSFMAFRFSTLTICFRMYVMRT